MKGGKGLAGVSLRSSLGGVHGETVENCLSSDKTEADACGVSGADGVGDGWA